MKILIDQNISHRLIPHVQSTFSGIAHVRDIGMMTSSDYNIFMFASEHKFDAILTLEEDFNNLSILHGPPPKIIWLRIGNCSTTVVAEILLRNRSTIAELFNDEEADSLEIFNT